MLQKFATGLTIVTLAFGCVSTKNHASRPEGLEAPEQDDPPAAAAPAAKLPAEVKAVADWDALPKDVRQDVVDGDTHGYKSLSVTQRQKAEALSDADAKAFAAKMVSFMRTHGDMTVQDGSHARVGPEETWVRLVLLDGKTILGGSVAFEQAACDMPDDTAVTFPGPAEAKKAGCELGTGAWSAEGSFNHDGSPFSHGDYMEWSGK